MEKKTPRPMHYHAAFGGRTIFYMVNRWAVKRWGETMYISVVLN